MTVNNRDGALVAQTPNLPTGNYLVHLFLQFYAVGDASPTECWFVGPNSNSILDATYKMRPGQKNSWSGQLTLSASLVQTIQTNGTNLQVRCGQVQGSTYDSQVVYSSMIAVPIASLNPQ
jgi:hypothetical protein